MLLSIHPADRGQHYHSFEVIFVAILVNVVQYSLSFSSVLVLREHSGSLAAKRLTVERRRPLVDKLCAALCC